MRDPNDASESLGTSAKQTIGRLKRRAEFLRVAKGRRWHGSSFTLQAQGPGADQAHDTAPPRAGFTVTKKTGNSVIRNRARRRLREALRLSPDLPLRAGHDYVLVARPEAIRLPFTTLLTELTRAVQNIHAEARPRDGSRFRDAKRPKRITPSP